MATVETGARLHFGFQNLALAHERLYGGVGVALAEPRVRVTAESATDVVCDDPVVEPFVADAVSVLGVEGARVTVEERFERHVGLGSGTQLALATLVAVARAHDEYADSRTVAPELGRGGRSGVGVACFEHGGFVVDAGHPTERFTTSPPAEGSWEVPRPMVRRDLPSSWRFVLVTPAATTGQSGAAEDESMRSVVERADPGIADDISLLLTRRLLPAVAERDVAEFGAAVARLGRLNGAWYADEQGGVYRPPAGDLIDSLGDCPVVHGAGQSSWGPTVYGVTRAADVSEARAAAADALDDAGCEGRVLTAAPRNRGATVEE
ncbi:MULTISPECIES: beta-ribofuranosylaminobenzene 5'-phosphate synthase family protein [Salinibaculum]|uniref:beta-ribofuranosylaminobenzene 5'-phosphate synthase family protein n=1 Tax=Salinibaculum TaxID=2732368 RepID=UPI0030CB1CAB